MILDILIKRFTAPCVMLSGKYDYIGRFCYYKSCETCIHPNPEIRTDLDHAYCLSNRTVVNRHREIHHYKIIWNEEDLEDDI